jgi:hypothetical protein
MVKERMPALQGVLELIHANPLVGLGEMHRSATEHEFIRELVSHPEFAAECVVIEFGNALYQELLDAYIGGEDVPPAELRQIWLNTTQSVHQRGDPWDAVIYPQLLATVRDVNRAGRPLRVLAGDPPVDWSKVETSDDLWRLDRDEHYVSVVEREVVSPGRRGLLLWGALHLLRRDPVRWPDQRMRESFGDRFPDMPVIVPHVGHGALNDEVEAVLRDWPIPSLAPVAGTALAEFSLDHLTSPPIVKKTGKPAAPFQPWRWDELFDYYLYLGPASTMQYSTTASSIDAGPEFHAELHRRRTLDRSP